jgi:hypothetical protein
LRDLVGAKSLLMTSRHDTHDRQASTCQAVPQTGLQTGTLFVAFSALGECDRRLVAVRLGYPAPGSTSVGGRLALHLQAVRHGWLSDSLRGPDSKCTAALATAERLDDRYWRTTDAMASACCFIFGPLFRQFGAEEVQLHIWSGMLKCNDDNTPAISVGVCTKIN